MATIKRARQPYIGSFSVGTNRPGQQARQRLPRPPGSQINWAQTSTRYGDILSEAHIGEVYHKKHNTGGLPPMAFHGARIGSNADIGIPNGAIPTECDLDTLYLDTDDYMSENDGTFGFEIPDGLGGIYAIGFSARVQIEHMTGSWRVGVIQNGANEVVSDSLGFRLGSGIANDVPSFNYTLIGSTIAQFDDGDVLKLYAENTLTVSGETLMGGFISMWLFKLDP